MEGQIWQQTWPRWQGPRRRPQFHSGSLHCQERRGSSPPARRPLCSSRDRRGWWVRQSNSNHFSNSWLSPSDVLPSTFFLGFLTLGKCYLNVFNSFMLSSSKCHFVRAVWTLKGLGSIPLFYLYVKGTWKAARSSVNCHALLCCRIAPSPGIPWAGSGADEARPRGQTGPLQAASTSRNRRKSWSQVEDFSPQRQTFSGKKKKILLKCKWKVCRAPGWCWEREGH